MRKFCLILMLFLTFQHVNATNAPLFPNSVVSNDLEFIQTSGENAFSCLAYEGTARAETPDKRHDRLFDNGTFVYVAHYKDGISVGLWAHSDFRLQTHALRFVKPVAQAIGKLPAIMRSELDHVVIHKGDETAFGEADGHFFVLYSDNILTRIRNHDLEETVFHESVHATLDAKYLGGRKWLEAQRADGAFVTEYAARLPEKEDLAESALFAWTILVHPGRLPQNVEARVREIMPNRLAFFEKLFQGESLFHQAGSERKC